MKASVKEVTADIVAFRMDWNDEMQERLLELESTVEEAKAGFEKCTAALAEIHKDRLYLKTHTSFSDYCAERFGFTRQWAHKLLKVIQVDAILNDVNTVDTKNARKGAEIVKNSGQIVREQLSGQPKKVVVQTLKVIGKTGEPVTAKEVKEIVSEVTHTEPPGIAEPPREDPEAVKVIGRLNKEIESLKAKLNEQGTKPKLSVAKAKVTAVHPVLIAMDNAWVMIQRECAYATPKPQQIYQQLRKAVENAL